jgi:hypothetical protein
MFLCNLNDYIPSKKIKHITMKKHLFFYIYILLISLSLSAFCTVVPEKNNQGIYYRVLIPTGKIKNELPILKPLPESDPRFAKARYLFENSFVSESVGLYQLLQQYLVNNGEKKETEPAYLLLSGRQGGFPMLGFYLEENGKISDKSKTWYVDMASLDKDFATLNSMTQIYPHEMGHVFFGLLMPKAQENYNAFSADIHYFSVTTNYLTAFNEGFAEHFENASRLYEQNKTVKIGIEKDAKLISERSPKRVRGLDKDFRYPLRLGYYRAGLLLWYQQYEDYKRYQWAMNADVFHQNKELNSGNIEKDMLYRNTGLGYDETRFRNPAQLASNEGVINTFFTHLLQSDLKNKYLAPAFYVPFLENNDAIELIPQKVFSPMQNYYLKLFTVLHRQMNHPAGDTSFLQLFAVAWERQFPEDKKTIEKVYQQVCGKAFSVQPMSEIWLMNEKHKHNCLVMDQYGGNMTPFYTFNLNTAEEIDLLTFSGITKTEAAAIIAFREKCKGFTSTSDIKQTPGISLNTIKTLTHAYELLSKPQKDDEDGGLNIRNIFIANGGHILLVGFLYFIIFWIIFFLLFLRRKYSIRKIIFISIQKFIKFYLLLIAGLVCFMFSAMPIWLFLTALAIILLTDWLKSHKEPVKLCEILFTTIFMGIMIIYSLI